MPGISDDDPKPRNGKSGCNKDSALTLCNRRDKNASLMQAPMEPVKTKARQEAWQIMASFTERIFFQKQRQV
jgi:hypothetical protein